MSGCSISARPYIWPHNQSMTPKNTAFMIIDMQRDFCEDGGYLSLQGYDITETRSIIPVIASLLSDFRQHGYHIIHTREGHRPDLSDLPARERFRSRNNALRIGIGDPGPLGRLLVRGEPGQDTVPELYPLPGEIVIEKPGKSTFANTDLALILKSRQIQNLILCGVTTDVCVHSTMRDANDQGYDCLLIEDACAAAEPDLHAAAIKSVTMEGGVFGAVTDTSDVKYSINHLATIMSSTRSSLGM